MKKLDEVVVRAISSVILAGLLVIIYLVFIR
jgi:hypothetical protein